MKKVCIIGWGKTGKSLFQYWKDRGEVYVYSDVAEDRKEIGSYAYVKDTPVELGIKSPGVPYDHPLIIELKSKGVPVIDEIQWAASLLKGKIVGITGTNGKTTTTDLLYTFAVHGGKKAFLAGNIGTPLSSYVEMSQEEDLYICELSSFQLENIENFHPLGGIITNLTPDHLQRHKTMEGYFQAKKNIYKEFIPENLLVLNGDDPYLRKIEGNFQIRKFSLQSEEDAFMKEGFLYLFGEKWLDCDKIELSGLHNMENIMGAVLMADFLGISRETMEEVLLTYKGMPHRYEILGEKMGIRFINDSKATNPESTLSALRSVNRPTVLILGGMEKNSDFEELYQRMPELVKEIIVIGECSQRLAKELRDHSYHPHVEKNLASAFQKGISLADKGWDILLSPACASWDMYANFEERGNEFIDLFRSYP